MDEYLTLSGVFLKEFFNVSFDLFYIVYGILSFIVSAAAVFILTILYKRIRKFPVKVNCWFCNNNTLVPYDLINNWDCPHCKQYNGFNKDGSYNKVIEEQYNPKLNTDVFNTLKPSLSSYSGSQSSGFCKLCNINQQLKIQQLALFTPLDENNYYEEIEKYREKLEKAYSLCSKCEGVLKETLEKQEYTLLQNRLNGHKKSFTSQKVKTFRDINKKKLMLLIYKNGVIGLKWFCLITAFSQFLILVIKFNTEHQIVSLSVPEFELSKLVLKNLTHYVPEIYKLNKELSFAGFLACLLACILQKVKSEHKNILVWGLLHVSFWSTCVVIQMLFSGICVFVSAKAAKKQFIYIERKSLYKKSGFQSVKKVFSEANNFSSKGADIINLPSFLPSKNENFEFSNQSQETKENKTLENENIKVMRKSDLEKPKRKPRKENNEEELQLNQEKVNYNNGSTGEINAPLNSSIFNKSVLGNFELEKNEAEMNGSFNEVYNGLNSLHLGGKQKKSNKSSNFLFSTPDFSQTKYSSIIKPAKLIKNLNSASWSESSEYNSRSSTPSSQKTEKAENNRFDFFKTTMPISVTPFNRHSPVNCWDYDGSNGLYNNFNYFPHGFLPFQQFPGPMGHTTIYTSSRPTNFPFPFSPWQTFASPKFSPTSRFSDSSDCDNLFRETSKNYEKQKTWFKLKKFSYYFSVFMNIFTLFGLFYFISAGIILVDWKLPTLNFFQ